MATWDDVKKYTWGEIKDMELTWGDLRELSAEQLMVIAKQKIDRFKSLPDDLIVPDEIVDDALAVCEPEKRPVAWSKPITEKLFDKFLDTVADPAKVAAFILLLEKLQQLLK